MTDERILYFVSGLGIGVACTLLWAPKSGAATRIALKEAASDSEDFARRQAEFARRQAKEVRKTVLDTVERAKQAAKTTTEGVAEAFEDGKSVLLG